MGPVEVERELAAEMRYRLERTGIRVTRLNIFGCWVRVDTFKKHDALLRKIFAHMGATQVHQLPLDSKGRNLDGSKGHQLVAVLG